MKNIFILCVFIFFCENRKFSQNHFTLKPFLNVKKCMDKCNQNNSKSLKCLYSIIGPQEEKEEEEELGKYSSKEF